MMETVRDLTRVDFLPKELDKADKAICAAYQIGKAKLKSPEK